MSDILRTYNFKIYIAGFPDAGFHSCQGLSVKTEYTEYREAGALAPANLFNGFKFEPIALTKGVVRKDSSAYFWWESAAYMDTAIASLFNKRNIIIEIGKEYNPGVLSALKNGNISTKDFRLSTAPLRYQVYGATVKEINLGNLNAQGDDIVLVNRLVLQHEGIERLQIGFGLY